MAESFVEFISKFDRGDGDVISLSPSKDYIITPENYEKLLSNNRKVPAEHVRRCGQTLSARLAEKGVPGNVALEIGCGAGAGSRPLVASGYFSDHIITDASAELAGITRKSIESFDFMADSQVRYGTLLGEDLAMFPENSLSAIFMFATLHHFEDWREILRLSVRALEPGGIVFFTDPCLESNLILSNLFMAFESLYRMKKPDVEDAFFLPMRRLVNATKFRGNPHAEGKQNQEDKHFFRVKDLYSFAQSENVKFYCYPNSNVGNFNKEEMLPNVDFFSFMAILLSNSQHFSDELLEAFFGEMRPQLEFLEYFWAARTGACLQLHRDYTKIAHDA